jgi:hypothetical protein
MPILTIKAKHILLIMLNVLTQLSVAIFTSHLP